jgi:hypothetical protein
MPSALGAERRTRLERFYGTGMLAWEVERELFVEHGRTPGSTVRLPHLNLLPVL